MPTGANKKISQEPSLPLGSFNGLLQFFRISKSGVNYKIRLIDIKNWLTTFLPNGGKPLRIAASDFSGSDYQNNILIGLIAEVDFDVQAAPGGLLSETDGDYVFVTGSGTLTMPAGKYRIEFF